MMSRTHVPSDLARAVPHMHWLGVFALVAFDLSVEITTLENWVRIDLKVFAIWTLQVGWFGDYVKGDSGDGCVVVLIGFEG